MRVAPTTDVSIVNINPTKSQPVESNETLISYALKFGVIVTFVGNVVLSYLVMVNKNLLMTQQYFIYITPRSLFFKIWPVIYGLLTIVVVHNLWKNVWRKKACLIFILSNSLAIVSTAIWSARTVASIVVSGCVLAFVDNTTIWFWRVILDEHMEQNNTSTSPDAAQNVTQSQIQNNLNTSQIQVKNPQNINRYTEWQLLIVRNIISFYIGWVSVAGTVIIGLTMVYWWKFSLCLQFMLFWITTPIAALAIYSFMAYRVKGQYKYCFGYLISVLWGVIGAIVASIDHIVMKSQC